MDTVNRGLKEWNAVIEALGQGKQSIIIRKYDTSNRRFLLYPTISYTIKDDYLNVFKEDCRDFVENNALPLKEKDKVQIKYYAELIETIEKPSSQISSVNDMHIWAEDHVKNYLGRNAFLWLLRVYKLDKPFFVEKNNGMLFAKLKKRPLKSIKPVLEDKEFKKLSSTLQNSISV